MKISTRDISWSAGAKVIVDGITIEASPGEVLGLLGPNGSGKSTMVRILSSVLSPDTGEVSLGDIPATQWNRREMARHLSVVQQQVSTEQDVSVREAIDLGRIPHRGRWAAASQTDKQIVEEAAQHTKVSQMLDRRYRTLSGGEQQRVQLARAFAQQGEVMILDEPTNHLDIAHQLEVLTTVRGSGATVIIALHDLNLAATFCDKVLVLSAGRAVAHGTPAQVLTRELIAEVYEVDVRILHPDPGKPPLFQFLGSLR